MGEHGEFQGGKVTLCDLITVGTFRCASVKSPQNDITQEVSPDVSMDMQLVILSTGSPVIQCPLCNVSMLEATVGKGEYVQILGAFNSFLCKPKTLRNKYY